MSLATRKPTSAAAPTPLAPSASKTSSTKAVAPRPAPTNKPLAAKPSRSATPTPTQTASKPLAKAVTEPKLAKAVKVKKPKLVRDSFTIPKAEYGVLADLKQRAAKLTSPAKKSELLRAGIKALAAMSDAAFVATLKVVPTIKTGRPAKSKSD